MEKGKADRMKSILEILPHASKSMIAANPHLGIVSQKEAENSLAGRTGAGKGKIRGRLTRTEAEFALILEARKQRGEILRWVYEGITLRWGGLRYTPDFVVFHRAYIKLIEIKGAWTGGKFERAVERFRHARTYWPEFMFELHQRTKDGWKQIL